LVWRGGEVVLGGGGGGEVVLEGGGEGGGVLIKVTAIKYSLGASASKEL
jgi:hypothetical protein